MDIVATEKCPEGLVTRQTLYPRLGKVGDHGSPGDLLDVESKLSSVSSRESTDPDSWNRA